MIDAAAFDVTVVGSGPGGGAMAWRLADRGFRVLVIEAGPAFDPDKDYLLHTEKWERPLPPKTGSKGRQSFAPMQAIESEWNDLRSWNSVRGALNPGAIRLPAGTGYHHVRGVGGSTLHFTGEAHRLHPEAMMMRTRFGEAADWPIDYAGLEPYYAKAEQIIGVAGPRDTGDRWRSTPYPLPAHELSPASRLLKKGAKSLNLKWEANARAALSRPYDDRPQCNYCGNCTRGCPRQDKGSVDVTFIRKALRTGRCTVLPESTVTRIVSTERRRASHVEVRDREGQLHRLPVKHLVIACGAIETPRLLLASASSYAPNGVANESGMVGRNLMESLGWVSTGIVSDDIRSFMGLPADSICWDFNKPDSIPGVRGGCRFSSAIHEAEMNGPIAYAQRVIKGWGTQHKQKMRLTVGHAVSVGSMGEFLPNARTFVDLDPREKDAHGIPLARIHSWLGEQEIMRLRFMATTCRKILRAAGVSELVEEYGTADFFSSTHVFGTCRMGSDARDSVVDAHCQSHTWENLYICDASVFPSSGGGESPSLTIEALAIRAADKFLA
ncbi:MAG: GMC family oxidoreductase [Candidatus Accumulibacter sp.]|uniref:GMC family oxidoreductase n=1 Tax=Accumulibacter sp. TaxID=2053492 RepID=UPI0028793546|nr:GMC family oxidoreductase [Accumulibacter sp.]MDS4014293.1 GMC family oxidoreductase [Accumulibacter sp.]